MGSAPELLLATYYVVSLPFNYRLLRVILFSAGQRLALLGK
jgi:hypothetical protein